MHQPRRTVNLHRYLTQCTLVLFTDCFSLLSQLFIASKKEWHAIDCYMCLCQLNSETYSFAIDEALFFALSLGNTPYSKCDVANTRNGSGDRVRCQLILKRLSPTELNSLSKIAFAFLDRNIDLLEDLRSDAQQLDKRYFSMYKNLHSQLIGV